MRTLLHQIRPAWLVCLITSVVLTVVGAIADSVALVVVALVVAVAATCFVGPRR